MRPARRPRSAAPCRAFFKVESVEAVATSVYSVPLTKGEIAAFAVETNRIADEGDEVARGLFERAASELGLQLAAVVEQTGLTGSFPIGLIGSNYKAGPVLLDPLAARGAPLRARGAPGDRAGGAGGGQPDPRRAGPAAGPTRSRRRRSPT